MAGSLDVVALRAALGTPGSRWVDVEHHATIGSTNARAARLAEPWHVVVADHQSAGRGRLTRTWEAPPGTSVAVSATVPMPRLGPGWLPLLAGLAVAEAVASTTDLTADLKWPNDVLLPADGDRKVCGILCEVVSGAGHGLAGLIGPSAAAVVVVGAGINLTQTRGQLPADTATSLALAGAPEADRGRLVAAYLLGLARWHDALSDGATAEAARRAYRSRCSTLGRKVTVTRPDGTVLLGDAVDVDDDGRLVLVEPTGARSVWAAGDVVHARPW